MTPQRYTIEHRPPKRGERYIDFIVGEPTIVTAEADFDGEDRDHKEPQ